MSTTVDQVTAQIHKLVNDEGFLWTSRNDHLHQVNKLLQGLSSADADQVLSKLSADDLKKWAGEVNSNGIFGADGLSGGEKKDLFNLFARDLDGAQLARVSNSFGSRGDVVSLGQSVAQYATADAKVAYVKQLAGQTTDKPYDFRVSGAYRQLSSTDRQRLEQVRGSRFSDSPVLRFSVLAAASSAQPCVARPPPDRARTATAAARCRTAAAAAPATAAAGRSHVPRPGC